MHPALPFFLLTAALVLVAADGLTVLRGNEDSFRWSIAASVSSTMRRGRGRPRKFAAPSRDVTLHRTNIIVLGSNGGKGQGVR